MKLQKKRTLTIDFFYKTDSQLIHTIFINHLNLIDTVHIYKYEKNEFFIVNKINVKMNGTFYPFEFELDTSGTLISLINHKKSKAFVNKSFIKQLFRNYKYRSINDITFNEALHNHSKSNEFTFFITILQKRYI